MNSTQPSSSRRALTYAGAIAATLMLSLMGVGASYALWNAQAPVNADTVTSGTASLSVAGGAGLDLTKLSPGQSVTAPITLTNTGSTKLNANVSGTTVTTNALTGALTVTLTASPTCAAGLAGGTTGPLDTYSTPAANPYSVPLNTSVALCLEIKMLASAPTAAQNLSAAPTFTFNAAQVR